MCAKNGVCLLAKKCRILMSKPLKAIFLLSKSFPSLLMLFQVVPATVLHFGHESKIFKKFPEVFDTKVDSSMFTHKKSHLIKSITLYDPTERLSDSVDIQPATIHEVTAHVVHGYTKNDTLLRGICP